MSRFIYRDYAGDEICAEDAGLVGRGADVRTGGAIPIRLTPTACRDLAAALLDAAGESKQSAPSEKGQDDWRLYFWRGIEAGLTPDDAAKAANMSVRGPDGGDGDQQTNGKSVGKYGNMLVERLPCGGAHLKGWNNGETFDAWITAESWADPIRLQPEPSDA